MSVLRWTQEQWEAHNARLGGGPVRMVEERKKGSKYKNVKVQIDGRTFDSKAEGKRYGELRAMESAGLISDLECQRRIPLVVEGKFGTWKRTYIADFTYKDGAGRPVIEDVKGVRTKDYMLKKELVAVLHGIEITEIRRGGSQRGKRERRTKDSS